MFSYFSKFDIYTVQTVTRYTFLLYYVSNCSKKYKLLRLTANKDKGQF